MACLWSGTATKPVVGCSPRVAFWGSALVVLSLRLAGTSPCQNRCTGARPPRDVSGLNRAWQVTGLRGFRGKRGPLPRGCISVKVGPVEARVLGPDRCLRRARGVWSVLVSAHSTRRPFAVRLVLPFAAMVLALLFLGYHGAVVWETVTKPASTAHSTTFSSGGHSEHAFENMEAGHGDSGNATYSDCVASNPGCLNAKTELALPMPSPVGGVLLHPVPFRPSLLLAHRPLPRSPNLSELSILRI